MKLHRPLRLQWSEFAIAIALREHQRVGFLRASIFGPLRAILNANKMLTKAEARK
jgi:hypothetical protein